MRFPFVFSMIIATGLLVSCNSNQHKYEGQKAIKFDQYMFQGLQLYQTHCLNCHQKDGTGLGKLIPPLNTNFVTQQKDLIICGIKNGLEGEILVNGIAYDGIMPGNPRLTPLEIAEIMTYISNSWGNQVGIISITEVEEGLAKCRN